MRVRGVWALAFVAIATACPGSDDGTTTGATGATTTGTQESTGPGTATIDPTTSISASGGNETSSTTDATASGSTSSTGGSSSSEGGFDCPMRMPAGVYSDCMGGCPGGNCLNIDGGVMGTDYSVCNRGCLTVCNCWPPPEMTAEGGSSGGAGEYTAELVCANLPDANQEGCEVPGICSCVLECMDKTCPAGMTCVELSSGMSVCAYEA